MKHDKNINEGWEPCKPGSLSKSVQEQGADQDRRRFIMKAGLGAIVAATGLRIVVDAQQMKPDPLMDFIPCAEVQSNLAGYVAKKITDEDLIRKIQLHIGVCNHCLKSYQQLTDRPSQKLKVV